MSVTYSLYWSFALVATIVIHAMVVHDITIRRGITESHIAMINQARDARESDSYVNSADFVMQCTIHPSIMPVTIPRIHVMLLVLLPYMITEVNAGAEFVVCVFVICVFVAAAAAVPLHR